MHKFIVLPVAGDLPSNMLYDCMTESAIPMDALGS